MNHTRVYVRDDTGTFTELSPRLAAEALAHFWEETREEATHQHPEDRPSEDPDCE